LLGPDGAGKSTLAEGLRRVLPVPVRIVYMGVFRTDTAQHLWRRVPGAGLLLRVSRLWWRSTVARYHRARGAVVVFDRYVFDAKLRPGPKSPRSRASYWVIERACPAPDLVLLLDAPGAVMFERKGEHDVTTLEQRRGWYLDLVSKLPQGQVIDATLPPSGVLEAAVTAVWKAQSAA
jgi:thymidylate kinase